MKSPEGRKDAGGRGALETAVRLLAGRALSAEEVRRRLARRGFPAVEIDETVSRLRTQGYLDDRALAYNGAASRAKRLFGRPRIAAELKRRGIPAGMIDEALQQTFADLDEDELAGRAAAKLLPGGRPPRDDRERARLVRALARRGFSSASIVRALGRIAAGGAAAGKADDAIVGRLEDVPDPPDEALDPDPDSSAGDSDVE